MAERIEYTDKDKTQAPGSDQRTWRDENANAVKRVVNQHANEIERELGFNRQVDVDAYELTIEDSNGTVEMDNEYANAVYIPTDGEAAIPVGSVTNVIQRGSGQTSIKANYGVVLRYDAANVILDISAQYGQVSLQKRGVDEWYVIGSLASV